MRGIANDATTPILIRGLSHSFGDRWALEDIELQVPAGTTLALLGPSGCGKSTLLKLLAGLLQPTQGEIHFGDRRVSSPCACLPPEQRNIGMVFQDYALWPHMSVAQNVAFPLRMRGLPSDERQSKVMAALKRVGLAALADRRPSSLSGGQQQRVALARAIVGEPRVLLFDEPLSNLDRAMRESLCQEMAALLWQLGTTAIYVTHDRDEAQRLAARIAYMAQGRIIDVTDLHGLSRTIGNLA